MLEQRAAHLLLYVSERVWKVNGEGNKNDVRARIAERSETIIFFLTNGIPQRQKDMLAINIDVVLEHVGLIGLYRSDRHERSCLPRTFPFLK
jgi:hypothetical protein